MTVTLKPNRILVTGAGGKLGRLLRAAWKIHGTSAHELVTQSRAADADIQWHPGQPLDAFPSFDNVIALWGRTSGTDAELQDNVTLSEYSRAIAQHCGAKRLIHLSSAAVYGPGCNLSEGAPLRPLNAYGQAKCDMEKAVSQFRAQDSFAHICLRLSNVVGADSLAPALTGAKPLHLDQFQDGTGPRRSYIAPGHLARILLVLCDQPIRKLPDTLNIAAPKPIAMEALAKAADIQIHWRAAPKTALPEVSLATNALTALLPDQARSVSASDMIADWSACRRALSH